MYFGSIQAALENCRNKALKQAMNTSFSIISNSAFANNLTVRRSVNTTVKIGNWNKPRIHRSFDRILDVLSAIVTEYSCFSSVSLRECKDGV